MPGVNKFAKLTRVEDALQTLLDICTPLRRSSKVDLEYADNRIVAKDIIAPRDYPHYDLSQVDGYAVRAVDTRDDKRILMPAGGDIVSPGTYKQVHTGGALPEGADAIVKAEDTDPAGEGRAFYGKMKPGENFIPRGSVVREGDVVFGAGARLKPTDIAMLAKLGLTEVEVFDRPRVLVIPTGDEVIERGKTPGPGIVNESNGLMCFLLIKRYGGKPSLYDIVRDDPAKIAEVLRTGRHYDLIVTSGGTSVGVRDRIVEAVSSTGRVLIHGVGLKPGRPMGIGYVENDGIRTPVLFLPGVTEACAATTLTFVIPAIRKLGHYPALRPYREKARLTRSLRGFPGAKAFSKVRVEDGRATPELLIGEAAVPGERAYAIVPENVEKYGEGEEIEIIYLE